MCNREHVNGSSHTELLCVNTRAEIQTQVCSANSETTVGLTHRTHTVLQVCVRWT